MAKRSQHSFLKRQKEMKRKDKAAEKMALRHGKVVRGKGGGEEEQQEQEGQQAQEGQPEAAKEEHADA